MSDDRFRVLVENLLELIWMSGPDMACIYFNQRWLAFTGRSLQQELGHGWTEALHPDDCEYCTNTYTSHFNARETFTMEFRLSRFDGEYRYMQLTGAPWFESDGIFGGYSASLVDITEHKQAEEERQQLQQQIHKMQKMEAVGRLTGGIAHDFNNILASIIGFTGLAISRFVTDSPGKLAEYLQEVYDAGGRAKVLVAQMQAFSHGISGEPKPYQLSPLVKQAVKLLQSTLPASIDIHTRIDSDIPAVSTDPIQLHQMVVNLCINACEAMSNQGRIDIHLHLINSTDLQCSSCHARVQGNFVELVVSDTGQGIDPEVMLRMFDPSFSTNEQGKYSGMGLSVLREIIHGHDGHVVVGSTPGTGSVFRLLFPLIKGVPKLTPVDKMSKTRWSDEPPNGQRILVVDNDKALTGFIEELLRGTGYRVTVKSNSSEVLDVFREHLNSFDLVVLGQSLPGLPGTEVAQSLLNLRPKLPIILSTGYSDEVDEARTKAMGICGYLEKPFTGAALLDKVERSLSQQVILPQVNSL